MLGDRLFGFIIEGREGPKKLAPTVLVFSFVFLKAKIRYYEDYVGPTIFSIRFLEFSGLIFFRFMIPLLEKLSVQFKYF